MQRWLRPSSLASCTETEADGLLARDIAHWEEYGFGPWALLDALEGGFVGRGGLSWTTVAGERAVELPWALIPSRWGRGLAAEAARAAIAHARSLGLPEVVSFTTEDNDASRRVMEKAGLALVGPIEHAGLPHVLYRARLR